jgi:RNA polymerase sigma-70 factor (ECF subfamily)
MAATQRRGWRVGSGPEDDAVVQLERCFDRARPSLYRSAFAVSRDHHASEDALQDGFVRMRTHLDDFAAHPHPVAWMHRIVVNTAIDAWRKHRKTSPYDNPDLGGHSPASISPTDGVDLWMLVGELTPDHQTVLILHYVAGLRIREISKLHGCSTGTTKSRLSRARSELRELLLNSEGTVDDAT